MMVIRTTVVIIIINHYYYYYFFIIIFILYFTNIHHYYLPFTYLNVPLFLFQGMIYISFLAFYQILYHITLCDVYM